MAATALSARASAVVLAVTLALGVGVHHVRAGSAERAVSEDLQRVADAPFDGRVLTRRVRVIPVVRAPQRVRPVAGAMTGWFGERRSGHWHPGVDLDGETGDAVFAAAAGLVVHAGPAPRGYGGYGNLVVINHPDGAQTMYAHLSTVAVGTGQVLAAGDKVGLMGSTGWSTGSHLHFEVRIGGTPIDPMTWLADAVVPVPPVPDLALGA